MLFNSGIISLFPVNTIHINEIEAFMLATATQTTIRNNWTLNEVLGLYELPFNDLLFKAQGIHRENFNPNEVQISSLLSIKTGGCAEDCKYCPQSARYNTGLKAEKLMQVQEVAKAAKAAKDAGAQRFCMGAAWTSPKDRDMPHIIEMVAEIRKLGLESCMTLGMLTNEQTEQLAAAGLDYYNHNIDSSEEFYKEIITTRTYQDRLDTLANVQKSGMKTCSGGILGMGETVKDRANMLITLANMAEQPTSVPINMLVKVEGTPLMNVHKPDNFDFVRTLAIARVMMPKSHVRLSAGREEMNDEMQALCFMAGANSIFYGEKLLTTANPSENDDLALLKRLGMSIEGTKAANDAAAEDDDWFEDDDQPTHIGCGGGCSHDHHR
jgi:biotin synthase